MGVRDADLLRGRDGRWSVREPQGGVFPVMVGAEDPRFETFAKRTGLLAEECGFPRLGARDRADLAKVLFGFLYASRDPDAAEIDRRLNDGRSLLVSDDGGLDSYDCAAVAHEIRRKRGAEGAIVLAIDDRGHVHVGCALKRNSPTEALEAKIMERIDDVAHDAIENVVLDLVVPEKGQPS